MAVAEISVREHTYRRAEELQRAGLSRKQAFDYIDAHDELGISRSAVEQRYYGHLARVRDANGEPPSTRGRRSKSAEPGAAPQQERKSPADALDMIVVLLLDVVREVKELEYEAGKWREVRGLIDG